MSLRHVMSLATCLSRHVIFSRTKTRDINTIPTNATTYPLGQRLQKRDTHPEEPFHGSHVIHKLHFTIPIIVPPHETIRHDIEYAEHITHEPQIISI